HIVRLREMAGYTQRDLSKVLAGHGEQDLAFTLVAISLAVFAGAVPFAHRPLPPQPAFIVFYQALLVCLDLVTARLLFLELRKAGTGPLFWLASGYLFTACMTVGHTLSFPGLFAPQGVIGGGAQTTAWIYMLWHAGFPMFVLAYALSRPLPVSAGAAAAGA